VWPMCGVGSYVIMDLLRLFHKSRIVITDITVMRRYRKASHTEHDVMIDNKA